MVNHSVHPRLPSPADTGKGKGSRFAYVYFYQPVAPLRTKHLWSPVNTLYLNRVMVTPAVYPRLPSPADTGKGKGSRFAYVYSYQSVAPLRTKHLLVSCEHLAP